MIVEALRHLELNIGTIKTDSQNARVHSRRNIDAIKASLRQFGQRKPVVVRRSTMTVEAGNGTLVAARELGWDTIAAVVLDDDQVTATAYALADNRTGELADWDDEALRVHLLELADLDIDIGELGFSLPIEPLTITLPEKDPNIIVRLSFHPGMWLGKRGEIMGIVQQLEKLYQCTVRVDE
jgi:ParB-like chromosome segregation protein Spo0J